MKIIIEILRDFKVFFTSLYSFFGDKESKKDTNKNEQLTLKPPPNINTNKIQKEIENPNYPEVSDTKYVSVSDVALNIAPVDVFDGVIVRIPYGTSLTIYGAQGRWYRTSFAGNDGWVLKDSVSNSKYDVYPKLTKGNYYDAKNTETIKLRTIIEDAFNCAQHKLPLHCEEFIEYILKQKRIIVSWPHKRPRHAGTWSNLLLDTKGAKIGFRPQKGSIIEFNTIEGASLAYVEAVFPDESIVIQGVTSGVYSEDVLEEREWKNLGATFINLT